LLARILRPPRWWCLVNGTGEMAGTERHTSEGKVLWHFTMSLDGFVAGPNHAMGWMTGFSLRPGLGEEYVETTGAVLGGRDGFDAYPDVSGFYGGAWQGDQEQHTRRLHRIGREKGGIAQLPTARRRMWLQHVLTTSPARAPQRSLLSPQGPHLLQPRCLGA
jgi:hypothetical protein